MNRETLDRWNLTFEGFTIPSGRTLYPMFACGIKEGITVSCVWLLETNLIRENQKNGISYDVTRLDHALYAEYSESSSRLVEAAHS